MEGERKEGREEKIKEKNKARRIGGRKKITLGNSLKKWLTTFPLKGQRVNILSFVKHMVSVLTT